MNAKNTNVKSFVPYYEVRKVSFCIDFKLNLIWYCLLVEELRDFSSYFSAVFNNKRKKKY